MPSIFTKSFQRQFSTKKEFNMDPASAKLIGAGLAAIGAGLAAIGVGSIFGQYLNGAVRNPEADAKMGGRLIFGFAVTEALGLIAAVVALALAFS
jgi:F-type H+-transporting ATPase subunit c